MKKNLFKISLAVVSFWFFMLAGQVKADAPVTIHIEIKTNGASLYDQDITVTACADSQSASTTSINAKCAIEQAGLLSDWSWYGDDVFLNSIGSYVNNDAGNGVYWGWFSNLEYGAVALNKHELVNGEKLLLVYNINPLKISTDDATPYVNATSTITVEQFGLDASWNPVWTPAASSSLVIAGQEVANDSGVYEYATATSGQVSIYGKKDGYLNSEQITLTVQPALVVNEPISETPPPPAGGSVILPSSGGSGAIVSSPKVDLVKAVDYLISRQGSDGSFGSVLQTDWAAIALASVNPNGASAQKLKSYLQSDPSPLVGLNPVSDYARRAMALMSLNISPYNGSKTNYIKKIVGLFDSQQFGDASLYNDDIFALLVLNRAGYAADEAMIKKTVDFIIAKQLSDGSWGGADLTAAAIQALTPVSSLNGVNAALQKARNFLANAQGADSGFGNTYTTAWAMQAIAALGESSAAWQKNNQTPESYLALSQGADGGLEKDNVYEVNRVWSTAYAIPAVQGKPWFNLLNIFTKEAAPADQAGPADNSGPAGDLIATSTLERLNSATSSSENLSQASTTEISLTNDKSQTDKLIDQTAEKIVKAAPKPIKNFTPKVLLAKIKQSKPLKLNQGQNQGGQQKEIVQATENNSNLLTPAVQGVSEKQLVKKKINDSAKKVLSVAGAGAIVMGLFLGLKLLLLLL